MLLAMEATQNEDLELLTTLQDFMPALARFNRDRKHFSRGLIETERNALGISQRQMASRMLIKEQSYQSLRKRLKEAPPTVQIKTIVDAADAMDCEAVIVLIPRDGKTFQGLAQAEAELRASQAKKTREHCKKIGRDRGGRSYRY